ncbi:serine/threonine-protein kinase [Actinomadura parmotrematis]|uniref:Protein kinase n=1 Tax=Actinomadura parmotrematis TaxID=2864039 RepID=A0ABS7FMB0_9ACTN|nr:serine/threonine-protein kinase [Actinomadura parmotrematis]MBW8481520.1 protein kinase [Actinomadura parmotrematis]
MQPAPHRIPPLAPGDPPEAGGCVLLGRLGAGGMGVVYLGRAPSGALVAVKTLPPARAADPEARLRFRAEAAYAQRVASFCTARVLDDGSGREHPYIVTEFIEGPPLSRTVERHGPLPADAVAAVAIGAAAALVAIHGAGLVHRDLKPGNVLLAPAGPRVIDFGIAYAPELAEALTETGVVMGSPGWIAPERLTGGPATAASDVFGWGCLVAYAATGRHPFGAGPPDRLAERVVHLPPDLEGLGDDLRPAVVAALAKDPADRPTAAGLLRALPQSAAGGDPAAAIARLWRPAAFVERPAAPEPPARRSRVKAGLAAAWASVAVAAVVWAVAAAAPGGGPAPDRVRIVVTTTAVVPGASSVPVSAVRTLRGAGPPPGGVTGSARAARPTPSAPPGGTSGRAAPPSASATPAPPPATEGPTASPTPSPTWVKPCRKKPRKCRPVWPQPILPTALPGSTPPPQD